MGYRDYVMPLGLGISRNKHPKPLPPETIDEGVKWGFYSSKTHERNPGGIPWGETGNATVTPNLGIPQQYFGSINVTIRDDAGEVLYEKLYDCADAQYEHEGEDYGTIRYNC